MTSSRRSSSRQQKQQTASSTFSNISLVQLSLPTSPIASRTNTTIVQDETVVTTTTTTEVVEKMSDDDSSDDNAITRCPCGKEKLPNWFGNGNNDNEEEDDDEGLMVQCDQCEVWQHCKCVGLEEEKDIPDQYYCEQCRPENHKSVKMAHGRRYKRLYNSLGFSKGPGDEHLQVNKPTKRRKRSKEAPGSRKSSRQQQPSSITDDTTLISSSSSPIFNADNENGWSTQQSKSLTAFDHSTQSSTSLTDNDEAAILTRSKGRSGHSPVIDSIPLSSPTLGRRKKQQTTTHTTVPSTTTTVIDSLNLSSSVSPPPSSSSSSSSLRNPQRSNKTITTGVESRLATPHPIPSSPLAPSPSTTSLSTMTNGRDEAPSSYWNQDGLPARESSPPAKIKYPTTKMTMADMNKRAKQIMEHIDKMKMAFEQQKEDGLTSRTNRVENGINGKVDLLDAAKSDPTDNYQQHEDDSVEPISMSINSYSPSEQQPHQPEDEQRPRSHSTCSVTSSISSASTLPLLLDDDDPYHSSLLLSTSPTSPLPLDKLFEHRQRQESSLEMMDRVYRELLKFQRKFGGVLQVHHTSVR